MLLRGAHQLIYNNPFGSLAPAATISSLFLGLRPVELRLNYIRCCLNILFL